MPKEQEKTERLAGLFDVVGHGSQQTSALCPFETPYVVLRHLKSGRTFRYVSDRSLRFHTPVGRWTCLSVARGSTGSVKRRSGPSVTSPSPCSVPVHPRIGV